jgi:hypothetical protein
MTPTEARTKLLDHGYQPVPTVGKVPPFSGWTKRGPTSLGDIEVWSNLYANTNTGILCATVPALDIDIEDADAARRGRGPRTRPVSGAGCHLRSLRPLTPPRYFFQDGHALQAC